MDHGLCPGSRRPYLRGQCDGTLDFLEDFDNYMLLGNAHVVPGESGGGVFTREGILAGILCGGNEADQIAVLPWSVMEAVYDNFSRTDIDKQADLLDNENQWSDNGNRSHGHRRLW